MCWYSIFQLQVLRVLHDVVYLHQELKGELSGRRVFCRVFFLLCGKTNR